MHISRTYGQQWRLWSIRNQGLWVITAFMIVPLLDFYFTVKELNKTVAEIQTVICRNDKPSEKQKARRLLSSRFHIWRGAADFILVYTRERSFHIKLYDPCSSLTWLCFLLSSSSSMYPDLIQEADLRKHGKCITA